MVKPVRFGRRYRAMLQMKWFKNRFVVRFLRLFFDVRMTPAGDVWIEMRQRVNRKSARFALRRYLQTRTNIRR